MAKRLSRAGKIVKFWIMWLRFERDILIAFAGRLSGRAAVQKKIVKFGNIWLRFVRDILTAFAEQLSGRAAEQKNCKTREYLA